MYRLVTTSEYDQELSQIEAGVGQLTPILERGAYRTLERDPYQGSATRHANIRVIRQRILMPLLLVQIYYRVDEQAGQVTLLSIVPVDLTRM